FLYLTAADLSSPFVSDFKICTSLLIAPVARPANPRGVKVTGRAKTKSMKMTFFGNRKNILDEKIALNVSDLLVNPACMAGVLTSRPNFNALWGLTKL
ncbi:MAG TPA: hypothetical protein VMW38_04365, partial [Terriglobia bacterium]|nr:hypothetical protein [Terriglobia bacterium]